MDHPVRDNVLLSSSPSLGIDESAHTLWNSIQVSIFLDLPLIWNFSQGSAKSLSKLAEDCISILRGEMEVSFIS